MIIRYFLGAEAFVVLGYLCAASILPKRYPLVIYKFLGVVIFSLIAWYMSQFTGESWTTFLLPSAVALVIGGIIFLSFREKGGRHLIPDTATVKEFIVIEVLSAFLFFVLVYLRTFKTDVIGTEKLMDVALINTILKQGKIPIENPWLSGMYMNYYYFGHFILAMLQYIAGVPSAVGYNLAISLFGVWIFQASYLVARSLRLSLLPSLASATLLTFGGNFFLLIQSIFHADENQWFASATRVIPYTINEFPSYSIVLGDLHGHYLSYPFFLVAIFLLLDIFFPEKTERKEKEFPLVKSSTLGIILGALYLTNSWDVFSLGLLGAAIVICSWAVIREKCSESEIQGWLVETAKTVVLPLLIFAVPQYIISKAYYLPPVGGIGFNKTFSNIGDLLMLFGQFVVIGLLAVGMIYFAKEKLHTEKTVKDLRFLLPVLLIWIGVVIVLSVELVYAKDVFSLLNPPYARTNTVFKMYYHAWAFFSLGTTGLFFQASRSIAKKIVEMPWLGAFQAVGTFVFAIMLSYSYLSFKQYIAPQVTNASISRAYDPNMSNGYAYIARTKEQDYGLILRLMSLPYAHIAEAVTYDSYSYYARVSAYTGHTTITGWPLHNVQWYNGYDGKGVVFGSSERQQTFVYDRVLDVETLYTTQEESEIRRILNKYAVEYVVFGYQEREFLASKGKESNIDLFKRICEKEWQQGESYIFACPHE